VHHASSGNLDRRGVGDVITLTVDEYRARGRRGRLAYRLIRNPLVMFGLGPIVAMVIGPRIATRSQRPRLRHSVYLTDAVVLGLAIGLSQLIGWEKHQFEDAYWRCGEEWAFTDAALSGSSHLALPAPLRFFTGSIGLHHVHHLNARIPSYNLLRAHRTEPVLAGVPSLTIWDGLRAINLKLWDQSAGKLVPFAQARVAAAEAGRS
jgi:acyl-lipid omega-6 desaturase (Delta-12 desaturase)